MGILIGLLYTLFALCGAFLILIVLIQRGKGGGLAGAFGGMGGHSAFGTRAGDKLMRITIGVAATWIILGMVAVRVTSKPAGTRFGPSGVQAPSTTQSANEGASTLPDVGGGQPSAAGELGTSEKSTEGGSQTNEKAATGVGGTAPSDSGASAPAGESAPSPK